MLIKHVQSFFRTGENELTAALPTQTDALIRVQNVSKTYYLGDVSVPVLHDIDLSIAHGELSVIVGPSGSGKSTLLNILGGIDLPSGGQVYFEDTEVSRMSSKELTQYRRKQVGFVFQFYNLVPSLTALENINVTTEISENPMSSEEALRLVGLEHRRDHFPAQMSGGEQQRIAIARAIAKRPRLLLCDEPTGALDLATGRQVLAVLERLNREMGMTVVIITHNSAIAAMARRVVRLGRGTVAEEVIHEHPTPAAEITW